jgi:saccharopine dehydrogenase-like NADP-dependent oxidoreductase
MRGIQRLGFFSNDFKVANTGLRDVLTQALQQNLTSSDDDDLIIARAGARGTLGKKLTMVLYEIFCTKNHKKGFSAMAQTTGYSAAIVAQLIADKSIKLTGVVDGELAVPGEEFVTRLQKTGIKVQIKIQ